MLLVLSLVALRYVDEAQLSDGWTQFARSASGVLVLGIGLVRRRHD